MSASWSHPQRSAEPLLEIESLDVCASTVEGRRKILQGFGLTVAEAEAVGIVGESGSGKSTLCRAISRTLPEGLEVTGGAIRLRGTDLLTRTAREVHRIQPGGIRMVFQHPKSTLNPVMPVGRQIAEAIQAVKPASRAQAMREGADLLQEMGITDAANRLRDYPHEFSGGQRQRIVIAIALAGEPALLLADEPTSSLDVTTQASILEMLARITRDRSTGIVLVSHNYAVVSELCSRTVVLYAGRTVERGPTGRVLRAPSHPYTAGLIECLPSPDRRRDILPVIPGEPPSEYPSVGGCPFAPRCRHEAPECAVAPMILEPVEPQHETACVRVGAIREIEGATAVHADVVVEAPDRAVS